METSYASDLAPEERARFWRRRVLGVRRFLNFAWLVEAALPFLFVASLGAMVAILIARREGWPTRALALSALGLAGLGMVAGLLRARRHFVSVEQARAEVDSALRLHTRLSAAAAGVGEWPASDRWQPGLWRWQWRRLLILPLCSAALVAGAFWFPLTQAATSQPPPVVKPPSLEKVESWLDTLEQTPEVDPLSIESLRGEARQLAKQDPAEWYSHASLEAAEHLKAKLQAGMRTLGDNASKLEKLLGQSATEAGAAWNEKLQAALGALEGNVPGLDPSLAKKLKGLDPSQFRALSPEEVEQLRKHLDAAKYAGGNPKEEDEEEGDGPERPRSQPGVDRGPGTSPIQLADKPVALGTRETEGLQNGDFSWAAIGEGLGTSAGQHEVDLSHSHRAAEGGAVVAGEAAGPVWQQGNLTPDERKRLQQYFK